MTDTKIEWTPMLWERFVSNIAFAGPDECWRWTAGCFHGGYGQFRLRHKKVKAHRAYYEHEVAAIPPGMILCHRCNNPPCCNPAHLFVGTNADNTADCKRKGRLKSSPPPGRSGESNPSARMTLNAVELIRLERKGGATYADIAAKFNISQSQARNIVTRKCWK